MRVNNRTEAESAVNSAIVATVTNTIHKNLLNDELLSSFNFRKDVIGSETPGGGSVTVNFSDKDLATIVAGGNLAVSFTNLENGDSDKYLYITKAAANVISFVGATDVSMRKKYINTVATNLVYKVENKNGTIFVRNINIDMDLVETGTMAYSANVQLSLANVTSNYARSGNLVTWAFKFDEIQSPGTLAAGANILTLTDSNFHPKFSHFTYMSREGQADGTPIEINSSGQVYNRNSLALGNTHEFTLNYMV